MAHPLWAYDINDKLSVEGVVAWAGQCQELADNVIGPETCRGAAPFQSRLSFRPTHHDVLSVKLAFAAGNGLNDVAPFNLSPWAADLEDDVRDINGRGRNHLLTAWYRHTFEVGELGAVNTTVGIIDATDYLNDNAYANNEYTQFMNDALSNVPSSLLPGYDWGGALVWEGGRWSVSGVAMNVGGKDDRDDGNAEPSSDYNFFAAGLSYAVATSLGKGTYRFLASLTSADFLEPSAAGTERLAAVGLSFDQQLGDRVGAFLRLTRVTDDAAVDYDTDVAGGLDFSGPAWGRPNDNIGLGYAYLAGGNRDIRSTQVAEGYYRLVVNDYLAVTLDVQYMRDVRREDSDAEGFIFGLRTVGEF